MAADYSYFSYENLPCRVEIKPLGLAEIYVAGTGFVEGPKMTLLSEGRPISKADFEAMVIATARKSAASS